MLCRPEFERLPKHLQLVFHKGRELLDCPAEIIYDELMDYVLKGDERIYKLNSIADELGFSERTIQSWRKSNHRGFRNILHREGRTYFAIRSDLVKWLQDSGVLS